MNCRQRAMLNLIATLRLWQTYVFGAPLIFRIAPPCFPFTGKPGLQVSLTDCNDPLQRPAFLHRQQCDRRHRQRNESLRRDDPDASMKTIAYSAVGASDQRRRLALHRNFGAAGHNTKATTTLVLVKQPSA